MSLLSHNLQAFVLVSKHRSVHGAAQELGLTQTGVTQRLRSLEQGLGASLFLRSRRGMALTAEGEALLRYCQAARDLEGETMARISGAGKRAEARISVIGPSSILRTRVVPAFRDVLAKFPELVATIELNDVEPGDDALRSGRVHLALLPPERVAREMDSKLLKPEKYVLVGPRAWRKRHLREVVRAERIIDFDPTDPMTRAYLKHFGLLEFARSERHLINSTESIVEWLEAGVGYGVLTSEFAAPHVDAGRIALLNQGRSFAYPVAMAWYPRQPMPAYLAALVSAIR